MDERITFTDLLKDPTLLEKRLPKTSEFFKQYSNLSLETYSRYWAIFAFMYDEFNKATDEAEVDKIFQQKYDAFKKKDKKYLDGWKYFAAFKRQELVGKTKGAYIYEQVSFEFQLMLRDEYLSEKETN